jgi:hypothetical protein
MTASGDVRGGGSVYDCAPADRPETHIGTHTRTHIRTYAHAPTHTLIDTQTLTHNNTHMKTHTHAYRFMHMYTCTHTLTHTHTQAERRRVAMVLLMSWWTAPIMVLITLDLISPPPWCWSRRSGASCLVGYCCYTVIALLHCHCTVWCATLSFISF